jgi:GTPase
MQFIDEATIYVKAGDGGDGSAAFRRAPYSPHGGPAGGDGGHGGSVIAIADSQLSTLLDFKYKKHYVADRGENGRGNDQYGANGVDLVVHVPVGTMVYDHGSGELVADLSVAGAKAVLAQGGHGGRGNLHFATPWAQAPTVCEPGTPGVEREVRLELKLLADVGLLGYPSVGKSTFISAVSRARPKIADYPFTTLAPNLGLVRLSDERSFVIADMPGLIEGAAEGAGLGHQFLRHVERTRVLLHILEDSDFAGPDRAPLKDFEIINQELARYAPELAKKPQIVVLNKMDLGQTRTPLDELQAAFVQRGVTLHTMSAATGAGVQAILELLWKHVRPAT